MQRAVAIGALVVGALLAYGARDFGRLLSDRGAGFMLGVLLLVVGAAGLLAVARQTVTIDPAARTIVVEDVSRVRSRRRVIGFEQIERVGLGYLGRASSGVRFYFLVLHLSGGVQYSLFAPGRFYQGSSSRTTVQGWRARVEAMRGTADAAS